MKNEIELLHKASLKSAIEDLKIAQDLFKLKHYSYALFFCHLTIEKVLKALFIKHKDQYPLVSHDLVKIARRAGLDLTQEKIDQLAEITTFNVEARYDTDKTKLYKKATKNFTQKYITLTLRLFEDFKKML